MSRSSVLAKNPLYIGDIFTNYGSYGINARWWAMWVKFSLYIGGF